MPASDHVTQPEQVAHEPMSHRRTLEALSGLLLVMFVALLSSTVVSVALPKIIGALNGSQSQYTWVITATLLSATASTPIWGKLADLFNKKLLVQIAILIFIAGSMIAGMSRNAGELIAARAFQGLGVGGLQALGQVVIAAIIPPRERGRYNGYLGAVMAVATVGGPLLGGLIVDTSWLGWRWCFFVGAPVAVVALILLQATLHVPTIKRPVKIDYLGATLIAAGVCLLLIWVSFVDTSFAWLSWQTAAMVAGSLLLLAAAVAVESVAAEPVVPLKIVRERNTALAIVASLSVGIAMTAGAVFLGQYFQIGRGYSPTEAGLLTIPMMVGVLGASIIVGRMVSESGRVKSYTVVGSILVVAGFAALGVVDHQTSLVYIGAAMFLVGVGVGMSMQNLVLAVQNSVRLRDIGAASSVVTFFRSLGGAVGVSVLGAVLARRVSSNITHGLAAAGMPAAPSSGGTSSLNINALPAPLLHIVRFAYGDATGRIFLIAAVIGVASVIASALLKPVQLRSSLDLAAPAESAAPVAGGTTAEFAASSDDVVPAEDAVPAGASTPRATLRPGS